MENEGFSFREASRVHMDALSNSQAQAKIKTSANDTMSHDKNNSQNEARHVLLNGVPIVALVIDGQERLCLAQISNTLLKDFSYNEIHNRRVALGITCVQCTPVQLEILRRAGAMPISSRRCGMITKREAERLCKSFLSDSEPPKLPEDFAFDVYHECAWGCRGCFIPSRYNSSRAKCIRCSYCNLFFSPNKFIFHSHRLPVSKYVQPDAANFNSWRRHIKLSDITNEDINFAWEDVKAMFNGGSRKRVMSASLNSATRMHMLSKRNRCEIPSVTRPSSGTNISEAVPHIPNPVPTAPLPQRFEKSPYLPMLPFSNKSYSLGGAPCFQPTTSISPEFLWNKNPLPPTSTYPHNLSSIIWSSNHGSILSTTLLQKPNLASAWPAYPPHDVPLVDIRSAVNMYRQTNKNSMVKVSSDSMDEGRSAFKPVQRTSANSAQEMDFGSRIEFGQEQKLEQSQSSQNDIDSESDIEVNDLSDGNVSPVGQKLEITSNGKISPVTDRKSSQCISSQPTKTLKVFQCRSCYATYAPSLEGTWLRKRTGNLSIESSIQFLCQFLKQKEKEKVKLTFEPERVKVRIPFKPDHFFTLYVVYSRALPSDTGYRLVLERTYSVPRIEHYKEGVIGRGGYARKCLKSRSDGYTSGSGGVFFILITT
ncbi:SKI family transcriptional corepressor 2 [Nymphon striatum]|nr:SKI family transcriptional corepressor 2 [Nymphon striatum]